MNEIDIEMAGGLTKPGMLRALPGSALWTALRLRSAMSAAKVPVLTASPPTITVPGATNPYGGSETFFHAPDVRDRCFTFLRGSWAEFNVGGTRYMGPGAVVTYSPSLTTGGSAPLWSFMCDAPDLAITFRSPSSGVRILIDGEFAHEGGLAIGEGSGAPWHIRIEHGSRKPRLYEIYANGNFYVRGIRCASALDRVWPAPQTYDDLRGVIIGDSFTEGGANGLPEDLWGYGFGASLPYHLGTRDLRASGSGATGYLADALGTRYNAFQRLGDLTSANPHFALLPLGTNDNEAVMSAEQQVSDYLDLAQAALPNCLFFVFSKFANSFPSSYDTSSQYRDGQRAACAGRKRVWYTDTVGYTQAGPNYQQTAWVTGGGTVYAPNGVGNADLAVGRPAPYTPDSTHPNEWGHQQVYAPRMAAAVRDGLDQMIAQDLLV
ncbi:SGNH/GDSL hydrolase family protein [Ancylobacter pratisalsi]|uniref:SGNH/GDSL hydrolase family protein n=1 Tax=Ancylobacter pratisalsi TaxID=1745854 RepID=A0A6P1YIV2_9HYPH|nr:SGNH/GDSL hydrolase family protein [Ancylobacter pratisalsi]QIB32626.1 SGNH/GDSL hydrolase family protein [Ancylobacter pratisalsi]